MKNIHNILILDDDEKILASLSNELTQTVLKPSPAYIHTADHTELASEYLRQYNPKLIFADMELTKDIASEGTDFIEDITKHYKQYGYKKMPFIAVVTGYIEEYAKPLQPLQNEEWFLGYFIKPVSIQELNDVFLRKIHSQSVTINWNRTGKIIPVANIAYLEKEPDGGKNLFIYEWTGTNYEKHTMRIALGKFLEEHLWNHPNFEQTHAAYAVQADYVSAWDNASNLILKKTETKVPVSETHRKRLKKGRGWFL